MSKDSHLSIKQAVGRKAASLVQEGMIVGIGSGTTAVCFIESLIERCRQGLNVRAVSTSIRSAELAKQGGIPIIDDHIFTSVDLCIDGADEIAPDKSLIKGGGGNLVREKIVASSAKEVLIIADATKLVSHLGAFGLPVEIIPFGYQATLKKIKDLGLNGKLRITSDGKPFITDNSNYIFDISYAANSCHPKEDEKKLKNLPGVVDTGFFFDLATRVLIGYPDGRLEIHKEL